MRLFWIGLGLGIVAAFFFWPRAEAEAPPLDPPGAAAGSESGGAAAPEPDPAAPAAFEPLRRDAAGVLEPAPVPEAQPAAPDSAVTHQILVLDQDRKPVAGISYARTHDLDERHGRLREVQVTDAEGKGRLDETAPGNQRGGFVKLGFHGPEGVGAPLPPAADPAVPVEVVLPPYGAIRVEVAPELSEFIGVGLALDVDRRERPTLRSDVVQLEAGSARIPFVGLHQSWIVSLRPAVGGGALQRKIRGPVAAGEEVLVRFESNSDPILTGILADEEGTPIRDADLHYRIRAERLNAGSNLQTDENGRFVVPLNQNHLDAEPRELEFRRMMDRVAGGFSSNDEDPASAARAALPQPMPRAEVNLGTLRFAPEPVLVSGRVRTRSEEPVVGANLIVDELIYSTPQGEEHWNHENELLSATSGPDGSFTIYGPLPERAMRLRVTAREFLPHPPLPLRYGETGLEIVLEQGGTLVGIVTWPDGGDLSELEFKLESAAGEVSTRGSIDKQVYRLKAQGLAPGDYALVGLIERTKQEFLRLEGFTIRAGEESTDPRLQPLDLSTHLSVVAIAPRAPDGTVPDRCMVLQLRENGGGGRNVSEPDGVRRLPALPGASADFLVECPGFRSIYLPQATGTLHPKLEPVFSVVLQVAGGGALANEQGAYVLRAELAADSDWPSLLRRRAMSETQLPEDRRVSLSALVVGAWDVSLIVPRLNSGGDGQTDVVPLGRIEIGAGDAGRVFTLDLPETLR